MECSGRLIGLAAVIADLIKESIKKLMALTPYRLSRHRENRFDATHSCLGYFQQLGYRPRLIIDGGAYLGTFADAAQRAFPAAEIHLVEPQPAARAPLEAIARRRGWTFHACALSDRVGSVPLVCKATPSTGARITAAEEEAVDVPASTIDTLFASRLRLFPDHRALLKLDLQGHELQALRGAVASLPLIELVLVEVSFFRQGPETTIPELVNFFAEQGFDLFDVVGLSGRTRDGRLRQGDFAFVRRGSDLSLDTAWA
jgi:FkbM family methyltransferase